MNNKVYFIGLLSLLLIVILLLVTGSDILLIEIGKGSSIPLGTFITWIGMIAFPCAIYFGSNRLREPKSRFYFFLSVILKGLIVVAIMWVPVSYFLAGNIAFTFSEKETFRGGQLAMRWFWIYSYSVAVGPILFLLVYWISMFLKTNKSF